MTDIFSSLWVVCSHWKFQKEKVHFKYTDDAKKIKSGMLDTSCTQLSQL